MDFAVSKGKIQLASMHSGRRVQIYSQLEFIPMWSLAPELWFLARFQHYNCLEEMSPPFTAKLPCCANSQLLRTILRHGVPCFKPESLLMDTSVLASLMSLW